MTNPRASGANMIRRPFERADAATTPCGVDQHVQSRLRQLRIPIGRPCSDEVFVRRVSLDVIGTLPSAEEAREFINDTTPLKRRALVDRLLARDEFADYWAMKWSDLLRVKAEFPINLWPNGAQAYYHWIRASIRENKSYDQFVREMLTSSGSNFRVPEVNFYRAVQSRDPRAIARAVALTFMGSRTDHWEPQRLDGMAQFFSRLAFKSTGEWKEEIVLFDPRKSTTQPTTEAMYPDGTPVDLPPGRDPRELFADWLVRADNPWFARSIVNRVWSWLMGRGIVHEPDDMRPDNPPTNLQLLDYLERQLVANKYDLKHVYRLILNSQTYQLSCVPPTDDPRAEVNFAFYPVRRLDAEVLIDALCQITGVGERYSSAIPEPFTFLPQDQRAVAIPDGSISSPFLELFGRSPRDAGLESERNNRPTAQQRLHLLNSSHVQRKLEQGPAMQALLRSRGQPRETVTRIYLTILSRYPTEQELATIQSHWQSVAGAPAVAAAPAPAQKGREALLDLTWALINSAEFLYRH
jgi:hypothetical protein